jgi:hypothetical protein
VRYEVGGRGELLRLQVPMVGKGVVESMLRVLVAVQGGGAEALAVQKVACSTLCNLSNAGDNQVCGPVAGRCARAGCGCVCSPCYYGISFYLMFLFSRFFSILLAISIFFLLSLFFLFPPLCIPRALAGSDGVQGGHRGAGWPHASSSPAPRYSTFWRGCTG